MSIATEIADMLAENFDLIDRIEGKAFMLRVGDWRAAWRDLSVAGFLGEAAMAAFGRTVYTFQVRRASHMSGQDLENYLAAHGVMLGNRGMKTVKDNQGRRVVSLRFDVKRHQARYAEYLILRAGFVVETPPVDARNWEWASGKGQVPYNPKPRRPRQHKWRGIR